LCEAKKVKQNAKLPKIKCCGSSFQGRGLREKRKEGRNRSISVSEVKREGGGVVARTTPAACGEKKRWKRGTDHKGKDDVKQAYNSRKREPGEEAERRVSLDRKRVSQGPMLPRAEKWGSPPKSGPADN